MPFFPNRRPPFSVVTDAAQGVGLFCRKKLPWLALSAALPGLPALGLWWQQGAKLPDRIDPMWLVFGVGFAIAVVFAALLLALRDRGTEAGVRWSYEPRPLCEGRAALFVERLLAGKRRLAFEQVCETMQERIFYIAFDREWSSFELSGAAEVVPATRELCGVDDWTLSPFARYAARSLRPVAIIDVRCVIVGDAGQAVIDRRIHLAARRDDWVVLGWERPLVLNPTTSNG